MRSSSGAASRARTCALTQEGRLTSTIYEAHPRLKDVGGGFTIAPNAMNVLEEVGVADSIAGSGALVSEFCFRDHRGKVLARYPAGNVEKYRWPSVAILRRTLHRILTDEVARQGIQVEYQKRLKELAYVDGGRVLAVFGDGASAHGDFLVGADGVHSRVRQVIFPSAPGPSYLGVQGVGGFVPPSVVAADAADRKSPNFTLGCVGQFGYCNTRQNEDGGIWWCHIPQDRERAGGRPE